MDESHRDKLQVTPTDPDESPDQRPFPTLVEALTKVHPDTGFNIEIKYPMEFIVRDLLNGISKSICVFRTETLSAATISNATITLTESLRRC